MRAYDKALALREDDGILWANRGRSLEALGKIDEALECYERVAQLRPDLNILPEKARAYMRTSRFAEALTIFDAAISKEPETPAVIHNRAICLLQLQRPEEALTAFDRVLSMDALHIGAARMKVDALRNLGRGPEAGEAMRYFLSIYQPDDEAGCFDKGKTALEAGFADAAEAAFRKLTELQPKSAESWRAFGAALSQLERYDESEEAFRRGLELEPASSDLLGARTTVMIRAWKRDIKAGARDSLTASRQETILQGLRDWRATESRASQPWMSEGAFHQLNQGWDQSLSCFREAARLGDPNAEVAITMTERARQRAGVLAQDPDLNSVQGDKKTSWFARLFRR